MPAAFSSSAVRLVAAGAPLIRTVCPPFRVTYRDTDQMGVAYHANFFAWFEVGRTELLRSMGRGSYRDWEAEGVMLPVASCWADFKRPARYDDLLEVVTSVVAATRVTIEFAYEVRPAGGGAVIATGGTRHVLVDREGKPTRACERLLPELFAGRGE